MALSTIRRIFLAALMPEMVVAVLALDVIIWRVAA